MNPSILNLDEEYLAEKLDHYHRATIFSTPLYEKHKQQFGAGARAQRHFVSMTKRNISKPTEMSQCVEYFNKSDLSEYKLRFFENKCRYQSGVTYSNEVIAGKAIPTAYVVGLDQEIYAETLNPKGINGKFRIHHSSFTAGEAVYGAGEMYVTNGVITNINNLSGHYKPDLYNFVYTLEILIRKGANLGRTKATVASRYNDDLELNFPSAMNLHKVYSTRGFMDKHYKGKASSISEALKSLNSDVRSRSICAILLIKDKFDLYKFTRASTDHEWSADNKISFYKLYKKELKDGLNAKHETRNAAEKRKIRE